MLCFTSSAAETGLTVKMPSSNAREAFQAPLPGSKSMVHTERGEREGEQENRGRQIRPRCRFRTSNRSVSMKPGLKQFTLRLGPSSRASDLVSPSMAPFTAASGEQLRPGRLFSTPARHRHPPDHTKLGISISQNSPYTVSPFLSGIS